MFAARICWSTNPTPLAPNDPFAPLSVQPLGVPSLAASILQRGVGNSKLKYYQGRGTKNSLCLLVSSFLLHDVCRVSSSPSSASHSFAPLRVPLLRLDALVCRCARSATIMRLATVVAALVALAAGPGLVWSAPTDSIQDAVSPPTLRAGTLFGFSLRPFFRADRFASPGIRLELRGQFRVDCVVVWSC